VQKNKQNERHKQIRAAAYELLHEKGYKATSMLAIAKRAKASNETLYAWYGNKQNLFTLLIQENASEVADAIENALRSEANIQTVLNKIGPLLLQLVVSDKAIALSRAAATDVAETGMLGKSLAQMGRNTIGPLIHKIFTQARAKGSLKFRANDNVTEVYLGLLIGDMQIRRATGAISRPSKAEIEAKAAQATKLFLRLFST